MWASVALGAVLLGADGPRPKAEIVFARGLAGPPALSPFGQDAARMLKADGGGLLVTLPGDRRDVNPVGVSPRLRLRGDFDLVLDYQIVAIADPVPQAGCGVEMAATFDDKDSNESSVTRSRKPNGEVFGANRKSRKPDGKEDFQSVNVPAKTPAGRLRMTRVKGDLVYAAADAGEDFRELRRDAVGTADVKALRVTAMSGWRPSPVEVRLAKLVAEADVLPDGAAVKPTSPGPDRPAAAPEPTSTVAGLPARTLVVGGAFAAAIVVLTLVLVGVAVYARRRSG